MSCFLGVQVDENDETYWQRLFYSWKNKIRTQSKNGLEGSLTRIMTIRTAITI